MDFGPNITGGTFTLSFDGRTTGPITWSADPTVLQVNIQNALNACKSTGKAVELTNNGSNNAFLSAPLTVPTGVYLVINAGTTLYAPVPSVACPGAVMVIA